MENIAQCTGGGGAGGRVRVLLFGPVAAASRRQSDDGFAARLAPGARRPACAFRLSPQPRRRARGRQSACSRVSPSLLPRPARSRAARRPSARASTLPFSVSLSISSWGRGLRSVAGGERPGVAKPERRSRRFSSGMKLNIKWHTSPEPSYLNIGIDIRSMSSRETMQRTQNKAAPSSGG